MLPRIAAALAFVVACNAAPAPEVDRPAVVQPGGWVWFTSADDNFRALFPVAPETDVTVTDKLLTTVTTRTYAATGADGARFLVLCVHEPLTLGLTGVDAQLDVLRDRSTRGADATIESEQTITLDGRPARELELRFPTHGQQRGRARVFIDRATATGCVLIAAPGDRSLPTDDMRRFFDAFELSP